MRLLIRMAAVAALLVGGSAHAQVIGLTPTPQALYFWNTSTSTWSPCPNTSTAQPFASTPQAFVQEGFNTGLGRWTPSTSCPGGLNTGLTSFQGRTAANAVLLLSDVNVVLQSATNCNVIGNYFYSPVSNSCILAGSGSGGIPTTPTNHYVLINGTNGAAGSLTDIAGAVATSEPFTAAHLTDSSLTSGDCVQAATAGILSTISGPCAFRGTATAVGQVPVWRNTGASSEIDTSNFQFVAITGYEEILTTTGNHILTPDCFYVGIANLDCGIAGSGYISVAANTAGGGASVFTRDLFAETGAFAAGYSSFGAANNVANEHSVFVGVNPSTINTGFGVAAPDSAFLMTEADNLDLHIAGKTVDIRGGNQTSTLPGLEIGASNAVIMPLLSGCLAADATTHILTGTGSACGSGGGAVSSVSNSDGTLTISPTTGAVVASIALGHANIWSGQQTFVAPILGTPASGNGSNLTALNATQLTSGTVPSARLPLATNAAIGGMEGDGTTLTCVAGVCSTLGAPPTGAAGGVLSGTYPNPGYAATAGSHTVLGNTAGTTGTPSFTAAPVVTSILAGTSLLNGTGINTSGNDFTFNISSANLFLATTSNATNVQIQAGNTFTLGALSGCLSADATTHVVTGTSAVCANTTSTSLTSGFVPKANGANSLINSSIQDTGSAVNLTEPLFGTNLNASGTIIDSAAGGSSTPAISATGTPFAGTGTTSVPLLYENGGTAPTTFSTAGTYFGVNAVSGFAGNFLDFHVNGGASVSKLDASGNLTVASCTGCGGSITFPQTVAGTTTSGGIPYFSSTTVLSSSGLLGLGDIVTGGGAGGAPVDSGVTVPQLVNFSRSLNCNGFGDSITAFTGATNLTLTPNNTAYDGFCFRMGGVFNLFAISGAEVPDMQTIFMLGKQAAVAATGQPNAFMMIGTNEATVSSSAAQVALYAAGHQAALAFNTIPSNNYNGGAFNSATAYANIGDVVQSGGISYISASSASFAPPNTNKTPASNPGYWIPYIAPPYFKIAAQTSTLLTGTWTNDITVQGQGSPAPQVQSLGAISSQNGATIAWNVPTPAGNPIEFGNMIMDGNTGTATVTINGSAPGANATILGNAASSAVIKTASQANSAELALVEYPTAATGAVCNLASSQQTSTTVASLTFSGTCAVVTNAGVSFSGLTNLTWLNGLQLQVQSVTGSVFTVNFSHATQGSATESTNAQALPGNFFQITVSSTPTDYSITNVAWASGTNIGTFAASTLPAVGKAVYLHGLATATFLNGVRLTVLTSGGGTFTASGTATSAGNGQFSHATYASAADTGTATINWIAPWFLGTYPAASNSPILQIPNLQVLGVLKQQNDANAAATAAYNTQALADYTTLKGHGAPLGFVDVRTGIYTLQACNPFTGMSDQFHPGDVCHAAIGAQLESAMQVHESEFTSLILRNTATPVATGFGCITLNGTQFNFGNCVNADTSGTISSGSITSSGTVKGSVVYCTNEVNNASTSYSQSGSECGVRMTNTAARTITMASNFTFPYTFDIKDGAGTAATGNITVSVSSGGTIDGQSSLVINTNYGSAKIRWVSSGVWETVQPIGLSNSDGTLTITPTTASLALAHANTWTATQSFNVVGSGSVSQPVQLENTGTANGTGVLLPFFIEDATSNLTQHGGFKVTMTSNTTGSPSDTVTIQQKNLGTLQDSLIISGAGNGVFLGTVTSALGNAAITSATGGTGVTSVTCATAACNVSRGSYTVVGGTATTGTIITLLWPTTTTAWVCSVDMNGGTGFLGIGHSVATATGMNITAGLTVVGVTFTVDYNCVP